MPPVRTDPMLHAQEASPRSARYLVTHFSCLPTRTVGVNFGQNLIGLSCHAQQLLSHKDEELNAVQFTRKIDLFLPDGRMWVQDLDSDSRLWTDFWSIHTGRRTSFCHNCSQTLIGKRSVPVYLASKPRRYRQYSWKTGTARPLYQKALYQKDYVVLRLSGSREGTSFDRWIAAGLMTLEEKFSSAQTLYAVYCRARVTDFRSGSRGQRQRFTCERAGIGKAIQEIPSPGMV